MKKLLLLLVLLLIPLTYANSICENTGGKCIYISPTGDDSNDGSFENPYQNWDTVAALVQNGDTVYFREGIHRIRSGPTINRAGATKNKYIHIRNYPGERAQIFGSTESSEGKIWELYWEKLEILLFSFFSLSKKKY